MELLPEDFKEEPTAETGKVGKGEIHPQLYGKKAPVGEDLILYERGKTPKETFAGWELGYRGWRLEFKDKEPRLGPVSMGDVWEPGEEGEVVSDWPGEEKDPFKLSSRGFHSLNSLKSVREEYPREDIYGSIIPYGTTFFGKRGYRSEKAKVKSLFRRAALCYICGKLAKYFVHNGEIFTLCERCLRKLEKLVKSKGYTSNEIEDILKKLADIYGAEIEDVPGDIDVR